MQIVKAFILKFYKAKITGTGKYFLSFIFTILKIFYYVDRVAGAGAGAGAGVGLKIWLPLWLHPKTPAPTTSGSGNPGIQT